MVMLMRVRIRVCACAMEDVAYWLPLDSCRTDGAGYVLSDPEDDDDDRAAGGAGGVGDAPVAATRASKPRLGGPPGAQAQARPSHEARTPRTPAADSTRNCSRAASATLSASRSHPTPGSSVPGSARAFDQLSRSAQALARSTAQHLSDASRHISDEDLPEILSARAATLLSYALSLDDMAYANEEDELAVAISPALARPAEIHVGEQDEVWGSPVDSEAGALTVPADLPRDHDLAPDLPHGTCSEGHAAVALAADAVVAAATSRMSHATQPSGNGRDCPPPAGCAPCHTHSHPTQTADHAVSTQTQLGGSTAQMMMTQTIAARATHATPRCESNQRSYSAPHRRGYAPSPAGVHTSSSLQPRHHLTFLRAHLISCHLCRSASPSINRRGSNQQYRLAPLSTRPPADEVDSDGKGNEDEHLSAIVHRCVPTCRPPAHSTWCRAMRPTVDCTYALHPLTQAVHPRGLADALSDHATRPRTSRLVTSPPGTSPRRLMQLEREEDEIMWGEQGLDMGRRDGRRDDRRPSRGSRMPARSLCRQLEHGGVDTVGSSHGSDRRIGGGPGEETYDLSANDLVLLGSQHGGVGSAWYDQRRGEESDEETYDLSPDKLMHLGTEIELGNLVEPRGSSTRPMDDRTASLRI